MSDGKPADWMPLGAVEPSRLLDARLQLHWAAQPVMAFADVALARLPDDSQSNLGWRGELGSLVSRRRPDGLSAGLDVSDLAVFVLDNRGAIADRVSLEGRTIGWALSWLDEAVTNRTGRPPERRIQVRSYEMPGHRVATGAAFSAEDGRSFGEMSHWFGNGDLALRKLAASNRGWADVRCWPHHFDLGTLISLDPSSTSIGAGWSPGDDWYAEPYFYVNPYGLEEMPIDRPGLESGGTWHTDGWFGAVLTATSIVGHPTGARGAAVDAFLGGAFEAARQMLRG